MKYFIPLVALFFISNHAYSQTDYAKAHSYENKLNPAIGLKVGELTGIQFQLFKGSVCGGHQEVLNKNTSYTLTVGYSRLIGKTRGIAHEGFTYVLNKPDFRIQLDAGKTIVHAFDTDLYATLGVSGGMRSYEVGLADTQEFTMGVLPGLGLEHSLWHSNSRNAPIYLTAFGEFTLY